MFDAKKVKDDIVLWIREWFEKNGKGCNAVIAISGGKDSSITAALLVEALGAERVIGVLLPKGVQADIDMSFALCEALKIKYYNMKIGPAFDAIISELNTAMGKENVTAQTVTNLPARLRMAVTYAVSQSLNGRVANTCNLSEDWVGYSTRYGDNAGDFSPLSRLTVREVKAIGRELGLDSKFIDKVPSDGLQSKTDEDNLGFTYEVLDRYIREGIIEDEEVKKRIDRLHEINQFKLRYMDCFEYKPEE